MSTFWKEGLVWDWPEGSSFSYLYEELGPHMVEWAPNQCAPYNVTRHSHPHYELLYIVKGCRKVRMYGQEYRARAGDLIIFQPGAEHAELAGSALISYWALRFKAERLTRVGIDIRLEPHQGPLVRLGKRREFQTLFARMLAEQNGRQAHSGLMLSANLVEFFVLLRRAMRAQFGERTEVSALRRRLKSALELVHQNPERAPRITELARRSFMSPAHFSKVFKAEMGLSPREYIVSARIEKAKELLAGTGMPAQEVGALLGYESPYFFYRQFKQKTGQTAVAFRRRHRAAKK